MGLGSNKFKAQEYRSFCERSTDLALGVLLSLYKNLRKKMLILVTIP